MDHSDLLEMLRGVNVEALAKAANVSPKTIYRIRQSAKPGRTPHLPTMATALALRDASAALKKAAKRTRSKATAEA